ncbi:MAG: hypothetical protein U0Q16_20940 [Bryobacteraceae bacterium]
MATTRKQSAGIALFGLALPMTMGALAGALLNAAGREMYPNIGFANILAAFWGEDATFAVRWKSLVAAITTFGAIRVGFRMLHGMVPVWRGSRRTSLAASSIAIAVLVIAQVDLWRYQIWWAAAVISAAAVITADRFAPVPTEGRKLDFIAALAWLSGPLLSLVLDQPESPWNYRWLTDAWAFSFAITLASRHLFAATKKTAPRGLPGAP